MIRRILVIGGIGLALAGGTRFGLGFLSERAWEKRKAELLEQALFQPATRRPWEIKFESMQERARTSPSFSELEDSGHKPWVAWDGVARRLDDLEKVWIEGMLAELRGLESVLAELRRLELEDLVWHGATVNLLFLRECTNALCGRAWIACEAGDGAAAGRAFADALLLARATDDGTSLGTMIRHACEGIVLGSVRSSLDLRPSVAPLREALVPLLAGWAYDPARAERCIRRDLSFLDSAPEGHSWSEPAWIADRLHPVEEVLALAHEPVANALPQRQERPGEQRDEEDPDGGWIGLIHHFHGIHAQRNVALTALALAAYREAHGGFPATLAELDDLQAEYAIDPLTEEPLPYAREEAGVRVGPVEWGERVDRWYDQSTSPYVWTLR